MTWSGRQGKGASAKLKTVKREEAEDRQTAYVDKRLNASLQRGLADSAAGRVKDLGDFAQYA